MAYLFGAGNTDQIDVGTAVSKSSSFSLFVRFKATQAINSAYRKLVAYTNGSTLAQFFLYLDGGGAGLNTVKFGFSTTSRTVFPNIEWPAGFTAGSMHTLVGTYDGVNLALYADADATLKATLAETGTPDQVAGQHFCIGGELSLTQSADSTIYEVGWWPGTVLSGAQAAQLGAGNPNGIPLPTDYWPLISNATALIGGHNGTVTGATLVTHDGLQNLYAAPGLGRRFIIGG